jgi:hypothetical protein
MPDLVVSITHSPASPTTADVGRFTVTIRNVGSAPAGSSNALVEIRMAGPTIGGESLTVPPLGAGESYVGIVTWDHYAFWGAGTYTATATVDPSNAIAESNESNNEATDAYTVIAAPYTLTINFSGAGSGRVTAAASGSEVTVSGTGTLPYPPGTTVTLTPAANAGSVFGTWTGCDTLSGARCIVTIAGNRSVTVTFGQALPDLVAETQVTPGMPTTVSTLTYTTKVMNFGAAAAGASVMCLWAEIGGTLSPAGVDQIPALAPGETFTVVHTWGPQDADGFFPKEHSVATVVDCGGTVAESNEANNDGGQTYDVYPADWFRLDVVVTGGGCASGITSSSVRVIECHANGRGDCSETFDRGGVQVYIWPYTSICSGEIGGSFSGCNFLAGSACIVNMNGPRTVTLTTP